MTPEILSIADEIEFVRQMYISLLGDQVCIELGGIDMILYLVSLHKKDTAAEERYFKNICDIGELCKKRNDVDQMLLVYG